MTVHIDRAHHHPKVYKQHGRWKATCPRCGLLHVSFPWTGVLTGLNESSSAWRIALLAALSHASEVHS